MTQTCLFIFLGYMTLISFMAVIWMPSKLNEIELVCSQATLIFYNNDNDNKILVAPILEY